MKNLKLLAVSFILLSLTGCNTTRTGMESYKVYGEKIEDSKIISKIRSTFRSNPGIPEDLIHVSIDRGILQLSGFVHTHKEADLAILTARTIPEVKGVINNIIVMSSVDYAQKRAVAESAAASK